MNLRLETWAQKYNINNIIPTPKSTKFAKFQVKIITSALDPEINEKFYVLPGIGNFGDRYFGTEPSEEE